MRPTLVGLLVIVAFVMLVAVFLMPKQAISPDDSSRQKE